MRRAAARLWVPVAMLVAWQLAAQLSLVNPVLAPPPSVLLQAAWEATRSGEIPSHVTATVLRTAAGFTLGAIVGLAAGLLMGTFPAALRGLEPIVSAVNATPKLVLLPLLLLMLGLGEAPRLALVALTVLVIVAMHTSDAIRQVRPGWVELAVNYGADRRALIRYVYVPACMPQVFTGLRLALGHGLVIVISCELVSPTTGLGSMIWLAWQTFSLDRLYVAILVTAALGGGLHETLRLLERRLVPWRPLRADLD